MRARPNTLFSQVATLTVLGSLAGSQAGCVISSMETVSTDRVYLIGPKTESEPGAAVRTATAKAVDTRGTLSFHVDRARECTVTSTPQYQKVHIEGREGKNVPGAIVTGSLCLAAAAGLLVASFIVDDGNWMKPKFAGSSESQFTGAGTMGITGILFGIGGAVILPRAIYHGVASGTEATGGEIQVGPPPPGAVRAPAGYDPKKSQTGMLGPVAEQPIYSVLDLGAGAGGGQLRARSEGGSRPANSAPAGDRALLAIPQSSGGGGGASDEYTTVLTKTEVCERSADSGVALALLVKDTDGVQKMLPLGKTNRSGDVEANVLDALEDTFSGWPASKQILLQEAQIVPVDEPSNVLGELDLAKYPALKYAEHQQSTKKAREALAAADAARREAAAKAQEDAAHAEERKIEAAKKAAACVQQAQSRCNGDCQGNQACVKKCMQKVSCR